MSCTGLPLCAPTATIICKSSIPKSCSFYSSNAASRKSSDGSATCRAAPANSSCSSITDFDLYDLLGIDSSSDQSQIKTAYRSLQKRCHPDIAGPPGHDMAIILNEAYSVLSNPLSRLAYDKEISKIAELRGYTGKPIYSTWFGSESEDRALFVDEVKCVGCLKCALFAERTFAIESVYGRARVVAQWADPEHKVQEAIDACPVDCISMVARSDLAALEFLMSKQPRGNVRVGIGNAIGARVSNIFVDAKKFQTQFQDAMDKASKKRAKETDMQTEARMSAIEAIRSISNWVYWKAVQTGSSATESSWALTLVQGKSPQFDMNRLREAVAAKKQAREGTRPKGRIPPDYIHGEEYWVPSALALPTSTGSNANSKSASESSPSPQPKKTMSKHAVSKDKPEKPLIWGPPVGAATIAAIVVQSQVGEGGVGGLKEHIGGSIALELVNSSLLQVMLAGITWYFIGVALVELVEALRSRSARR